MASYDIRGNDVLILVHDGCHTVINNAIDLERNMDATKKCCLCLNNLPLDNFWKNGQVEGVKKYRARCKKCESLLRNKEKYKILRRLIANKYVKRNINKVIARSISIRKVPLGNQCSMCGSKNNLERHHPDYSKPLKVLTVCKSCHTKIHYK